jgi:hypothetical protein
MQHQIVVEQHRYDTPHNIYRFFTARPKVETDPEGVYMHYWPFGRQGQVYVETDRQQVNSETATKIRMRLQHIEGYRRLTLSELPDGFDVKSWCPIEFHMGLAHDDPEITHRIAVWVKGEFPS